MSGLDVEEPDSSKNGVTSAEPTPPRDEDGAVGLSEQTSGKNQEASTDEASSCPSKPPAVAVTSPTSSDNEASSSDDENVDVGKIAPVSDLSDTQRRICVVTTAAVPWRTGTAVNPLSRALYLTRGRPKGYVTLMVPWLAKKEEQGKVYGKDTFDTQEQQEEWIRQYSKDRCDCAVEEANLNIQFYPAFYHDMFGSIFATVDICSLIPDDEADVAILEEPEHLTWFRVLPNVDESAEKDVQDKAILGWTGKFSYVVGILHTNYSAYMRQYGLGASIVTASALQYLSSIVVRAYTHRLIRLSGTLNELDKAKEVTCNVHGVRTEFFEPPNVNEEDDFEPQPIYFIGKVIWAKGFDKLLEIEDLYRKETGDFFPIDVYGSGSDSEAIKRAFLGRNGLSRKYTSADSADSLANKDEPLSPTQSVTSPEDQTAALVFCREGNLREQVEEGQILPEGTLVVEVQTAETPTNAPKTPGSSASRHPEDVISHLGEKTLETTTGVSKAIMSLSERITNLGLRMAFSEESKDGYSSGGEGDKPKFFFDPPKTRYELRRYAIPARFLGVQDHAILRDIPGHKIFVNLSITEVLCTTTAEALAMGKFVVIPVHRKWHS